jgi:GTP cyclohydrolase II
MHDQQLKKAVMKAARGGTELRRGGTVMLRLANGACGLCRAAELSDIDDMNGLSRMAGSAPLLVLTAPRLSSLGLALRNGYPVATVALPQSRYDAFFDLAFAQTAGHGIENETIIAEKAGSLADMAARLLRSAKLVPAALFVRLPLRDVAAQDRFALEHNMMIVGSRDIKHYSHEAASLVKIAARARVPLAVSEDAEIVMFRAEIGGEEHFAVLIGTGADCDTPLVRLHSQCVTGDILGSLKCDCGDQLQAAMRLMADTGGGVLVYLAQEGRDIGLLNKMRAYALQDNGLDTVDANHALGFDTDERLFLPAARILQALNISKIQLITNNPDKISQLEQHGINVTKRVQLALAPNPHNQNYLQTKQARTGHIIDKI